MIDKDKRYAISEVSKITGYDTHVLRYYEDEFKLKIPRTDSNRRYYTYKEIEQFIYIKELQEKGLTNKQIKLVFDTPEILIQSNSEIAAASNVSTELSILDDSQQIDFANMLDELCLKINDTLKEQFAYKFDETKQDIIHHFDNVMHDMEESDNLYRKDKDILICENARLKMRLKQKSYELAELKDQVKRANAKPSFLKKILGLKKDVVL